MSQSTKEQLFRPYLSGEDILNICSLLSANPSPQNLVLYKKLDYLARKINAELTRPAYVTSPKLSISQKLEEGFLSNHSPSVSSVSSVSSESLYKDWQEGKVLNLKQIQSVMLYRYETDGLMTAEEIKEYEISQGIGL